ncbi:hypothetical protein CH249_01225 [Rhodococcus sp. 05-2255-3B1]|nr:hypothetical protein CH250_06135 [Rhodococcus sp. 05-2255-3C]OZE15905.1 hypothetical protein CH249_01225 [Rhodococcus sp. 05-2255-3B1]OZE18944.1 hypothetical protein CH255_13250 [Rhodococcus sp. 05-2255-2A2]
MSGSNPKSWLDQLIGAAFAILIAAIALYCAVALIQSILPFLLIAIGILTVAGTIVFVVILTSRNGW